MKCRKFKDKNYVFFGRTGQKNYLKISNDTCSLTDEYVFSGWKNYINFDIEDFKEYSLAYIVPEGEESFIGKIIWDDKDNHLNGKIIINDEMHFVVYTNEEEENYAESTDAVVESLKQRLSVIKGELWYQQNFGLPLTEKYRSKGTFDSTIVNIIKSHPGVRQIKLYSSSVNGHTYTFTAQIQSVFGDDVSITNTYSI